MTEIQVDPELQQRTRDIASARARAEATAADVTAAFAEVTALQARLGELDERRAALIERRVRGEHRPDDGQEAELLALDREGLESMIAEAESVAEIVQGKNAMAQQELQAAEAALRRLEQNRTAAALSDYLVKVIDLQQRALAQHADVALLADGADPKAALAGLIAHAEKLDIVIRTTVAQIVALGQQAGQTLPAWGPSPATWEALRRVQSMRGAL